jgi:hypothetical protein
LLNAVKRISWQAIASVGVPQPVPRIARFSFIEDKNIAKTKLKRGCGATF